MWYLICPLVSQGISQLYNEAQLLIEHVPIVAPCMEGNPDLAQPGLTETNSLGANPAAAPVGPVRFPWPLGTLKRVYATQPSRDRGVLNLEAPWHRVSIS